MVPLGWLRGTDSAIWANCGLESDPEQKQWVITLFYFTVTTSSPYTNVRSTLQKHTEQTPRSIEFSRRKRDIFKMNGAEGLGDPQKAEWTAGHSHGTSWDGDVGAANFPLAFPGWSVPSFLPSSSGLLPEGPGWGGLEGPASVQVLHSSGQRSQMFLLGSAGAAPLICADNHTDLFCRRSAHPFQNCSQADISPVSIS